MIIVYALLRSDGLLTYLIHSDDERVLKNNANYSNNFFYFTDSSIFLSDLKELPTLTIGDLTIRLETEEPSTELKEIARKELRETSEVVESAKKELIELLKGKPAVLEI